VLRDVLRMDGEALDEAYDRYIQQRFGRTLAAVNAQVHPDSIVMPPAERTVALEANDLFGQIAAGRRAFDAGDMEEAERRFERVEEIFPDYAGPASAYTYLARIHETKGDARSAADALAKHTAINENDDAANLRLAVLLDSLGDRAGAAAALERVVYIYPYDASLHEKLAELYGHTGDRAKVVLAREALLALRPVDQAEARYQLALAHFQAGNTDAARREVIRALEIAPNFERAQELLLRIRGGGAGR
jgi:tetratricopeptide (TPR) repeat protein